MNRTVIVVAVSIVGVAAARFGFSHSQSQQLAWRAGARAESELRILSGEDGVIEDATRAGSRCVITKAGSLYVYFQLTRRDRPKGTSYIEIEYLDSSPGSALSLQYDSATGDSPEARYRAAEEQAGGLMLGSGRWRRAVFRVDKPLFAHRQNLGADFRLQGGSLVIRQVAIVGARPRDWDAIDKIDVVDVKPLVKIGEGCELIVGGFDPTSKADARRQARALEAAIPSLKQLGVTSHEVYVRWNLCEIKPGVWDWSIYDRYAAIYKKHGLKWVPFLICGSAYSLPDWYYKKPGSLGYVCLEHHQESDVQSLWNPEMRRHVREFIRAFCEHYRDSGTIESILLGITGNYGEAIYPVTGNDWTADIHGKYHSHPGFWAGDMFAESSFQKWLIVKYGGASHIRDGWGAAAGDANHIKPLLRRDAPHERAWLDMVSWYKDSMTEYARFWLRETRANFKGPIYLCTGGHAPAEHGADFGAQCKAAAEFEAGVRITNEGSDYRANFSLTRWVASACRQYGAYFSFEPAGGVDANGVVARIYNATASGAKSLHYYYGNLFDTPAARQNFVRSAPSFVQRKPLTEIAVYYPETHLRLNGGDFLRFVQPLRDRFDFAYMSDGMIEDDGLKACKALILLDGATAERRVWQKIADWVRDGGLLLYPDAMGRLRTVEGDERFHDILLGERRNLWKGEVVNSLDPADSPAYRSFVVRTLLSKARLSPATRAMLSLDGKEDGVLATVADDKLLWLNYTPKPTTIAGATIPPYSIAEGPVK